LGRGLPDLRRGQPDPDSVGPLPLGRARSHPAAASRRGVMAEGRVLLTIAEGVATLTLERPAKLNALDPAMLGELEGHLERLDHDPEVRVVIVTGAGERAFCVGADVNAWSALD